MLISPFRLMSAPRCSFRRYAAIAADAGYFRYADASLLLLFSLIFAIAAAT